MLKIQFLFPFLFLIIFFCGNVSAQRGYFDAPYKRYEADMGILNNVTITSKSYRQSDLQSEASGQVCVDMSNPEASVEWTLPEAADGLVVRYSVPDGESAVVGIYDGNQKLTSLTLTSKWSWEYLWNNGDPNNAGVKNKNPRMRFDEVRYKLPAKTTKIKLVKESGNLFLDFIEMEPVPDQIPAPEDAAVFSGNGAGLQAFIDANGSKTIYVPAGIYHINSQLYFGVSKTKLQGAGMWYTQLNFTVTDATNGGLRANANQISYSDLYLTTEMTTRTKGYGGIQGVYTPGSTIRNIWVEHCATGAWIAQYVNGGPAYADGFVMSDCRFRNTYADGINLCKGTRNAIVEHCNFRNNGDDGMAVWCAEGLECINNTFRNNTVENVWRAAGIGLYGGKDNKFYDLIIKDNLEIGITINNFFQGVGFNIDGMHDFHDITMSNCGTFNDTENARVGAVNITNGSSAGTKIQNIRFYNLDIVDSKCDAIRIARNSGDGITNLKFENISINGTGTEYPENNIAQSTAARGFAVIVDKFPIGAASYCNLNYSNLGGNSNGAAFNLAQKGNFSLREVTDCNLAAVSGMRLSPVDSIIQGGVTFQLVPVFTPENATNKILWYESNNPAIATVSYDGLVISKTKGQALISVTTQDGNFKDSVLITVTSTPKYSYTIRNRWQNTYLYDAGDRVRYSETANNTTCLWSVEEVDGVKEIKNYSTGDYMNIENLTGYVQCTQRTPGTLSSRWSFEDAGEDFVRLKSESVPTNYIHIENLQNQAQYGPVAAPWWSAMWLIEPVGMFTSVKNQYTEKETKIYPNPSCGEFNLLISDFAPNEPVTITVFNLVGQTVFFKSCLVDENGFQNIRISAADQLTSGNYLVVAKGNSTLSRSKLTVCK
ncbi:MAG: Ig-like domain-containing protein [Prolixibacteraceae bacterium]